MLKNKLFSLVALTNLFICSFAQADGFNVQVSGDATEICLGGGPGGAAEELVGYLAKGGASSTANDDGGMTYTAMPVWGWKSLVPGVSYTFFMKLQPGEEKALNLGASFESTPDSPPQGHVQMPDAASAVLYDLMLKSGIQADPNDAAKTLYGKNVICWGFHGYPVGQTKLNPSCEITVK